LEDEQQRQPEAGGLFCVEAPCAGVPVPRFRW
jgi:hypothetical protein